MVNNSDTKVSYRGNGQTTVFPFSFPFIQRDYIKVAIYDSLTDETKTIDSDYYVDTVANTVIYPGYEPGQEPAEALRPPILPATSTITIYRQTDVDQLTDLGEKYPLKDVENMADKLTEIIQEQAETLGRAVKVPVGDPKTPEEKLTDLQNYVKAAADSAADAADSEASAQRAAEAAATSEANAAESERLASGYADTASDAASRAEDSAISARAYNAPDYDNAKTYQAGEVVTYTDGNSYKALQETTGHEPPNIIYWQKVTDYVGDNFFEIDEYGYIVPMDSPSHSRYWRVDQDGYIVPIEGGDGGYRPDTRSLSAEYLNVTNEGYIKHLRADDIAAQEVDADEMTAEVAAFNALTANAVNAGTVTADDIIAKGPIVDVRAFGAVGDGVHDDTAAIQAAIDNNPHCIIYFPSGTYIISDSITTSANEADKVILHLGSSTIKASNEYPTMSDKYMFEIGLTGADNGYAAVAYNNAVICGTLDGNGRAYGGLRTQNTHLAKFKDITVKRVTDVGMEIGTAGDNNSSDVYANRIYLCGTDKGESIGLLVIGYDNNISYIRTADFPIGIKITGSGNYFTECHPLWYGTVLDGLNEIAFWVEGANDVVLQNCYADAFATCIYLNTSYPLYVHNFFGLYMADHPSTDNCFLRKNGYALNAYIYNARCTFVDNASYTNKSTDCTEEVQYSGCGFYGCTFENVTDKWNDKGVSSALVYHGNLSLVLYDDVDFNNVRATGAYRLQEGVPANNVAKNRPSECPDYALLEVISSTGGAAFNSVIQRVTAAEGTAIWQRNFFGSYNESGQIVSGNWKAWKKISIS